MDKPKEPIKIIKFDKVTAQLHVRVETQGNLVSTIDPKIKTGHTTTLLVQVIYKKGIGELIKSLEEQKAKHEDAKKRTQMMLDGEITALDMIDGDLKTIKDAIGDLKFEEIKVVEVKDAKSETSK